MKGLAGLRKDGDRFLIECPGGNHAARVDLVGGKASFRCLSKCGADIPAELGHETVARVVRKLGGSAKTNAESNGHVELPAPLRNPTLDNAKPVEFAWRQRVAIGKVNLLIGNEGVGKGAVVSYLTARWTKGELDGSLRGEPVGVLIVGDEDALDDTWTPRLHAAAADFSKVFFPPEDAVELDVTIEDGIETLRHWIALHGVKVVVFDALLDNLGVSDDFKPREVRAALRPLRRLAGELDVAAVGSLHPRKGRTVSFRDLISGSHQFNAVSRSSLLLAQHPDDPNDIERRRVLLRGKGNLSLAPMPLEFRLASCTFALNGHNFDQPLADEWCESDIELEDALSQEVGAPALREEEARSWLLANLTENWQPSGDVKVNAAAAGHRERTLKRAFQKLREEELAEYKDEGQPRRTFWRLSSRATTREREDGPADSSPLPSQKTDVQSGQMAQLGQASLSRNVGPTDEGGARAQVRCTCTGDQPITVKGGLCSRCYGRAGDEA
jgi:hypothetical protein